MSNKRIEKKKNKNNKPKAEDVKKMQQEKEEAIEKIKVVLETLPAEQLEFAAEVLAPGFDYEFEARGLAIEEERGPLPDAKINKSKYPKEKKLRTSIGKYFLRDKHRKVLGATILLFLAVVLWQGLDYIFPENVHVTYQTVEGIERVDLKTRTETVDQLLEELREEGYKVSEKDAVHPAAEAAVKDGMYVKVLQSVEKTAVINGKECKINMIPGTVNDNLSFNGITYDENDAIKPALFSKVDEDTKIVVDEIHYKTVTKQEKVEAESIVVLDPTLKSGVQERTEGNDGEGVFRYTYKYVNGKKVKTYKKVKKWIKEPHDNALRLGTSRTGQSGKFKVVRTFTANCTAYTARKGAGGALGEGVHLGTCAVDPKFVPYRSKMWIEGYGYAYANDCGSAVKKNVVDLFMNSMSECIKWGRRNQTAYILEPVD